jgi:hypothetical protein
VAGVTAVDDSPQACLYKDLSLLGYDAMPVHNQLATYLTGDLVKMIHHAPAKRR